MAGIHSDTFDIYGGVPALMLNGRYSSNTGAILSADPDGVSVGDVLHYQGNGTMRRAIAVPDNKIGLGMRFWAGALPSSDDMRPMPMLWADASNRGMVRIIINTTGSITAQVFDTTSGDFGNWFDLATTPGPVISANGWWQIEACFDASALTFELRVEGRVKIDCDSSDFGGHLHNGPNIYQFGLDSHQTLIGDSINTYYKDYFGWDGNGSENNDFLGSCLVNPNRPNSDADLGGWVPSVGTTAWEILNTQAPGDTPYISAETPLPVDPVIMGQTSLPPDITSVKFLMTVVRASKVDGGDGQLQVSLISGGDQADGDDRPITAAMTYWEDVFELDPHTDAPWVPAAVDAAQIQLNRTV